MNNWLGLGSFILGFDNVKQIHISAHFHVNEIFFWHFQNQTRKSPIQVKKNYIIWSFFSLLSFAESIKVRKRKIVSKENSLLCWEEKNDDRISRGMPSHKLLLPIIFKFRGRQNENLLDQPRLLFFLYISLKGISL